MQGQARSLGASLGDDDARAIAGAVERFSREVISPAVERPERPLASEAVAPIVERAAAAGILAAPGSGEAEVGLWQGLDEPNGLRLSVAMLGLLGRANAAVAVHLHQLALGRFLADALGLAHDRWIVPVLGGRVALGRDALGALVCGAPLDGDAVAILRDTLCDDPGARLLVQAAEPWEALLVPVLSLAESNRPRVDFRLYPRAEISAEPALFSHGLDESRVWHVTLPEPGRGARATVETERAASVLCQAIGLHGIALMAVGRGALGRAVDLARRYAATRVQGGRRIEEHPAVALMLAEAASVFRTVGAVLASFVTPPRSAAALGTVLGARIVVHPLLCHAANEALQVLGGLGYTREAGIEKIVRDNNHMRLMCGAPDELRLIVAAIDRHTDAEGV